MCTGQQPYSNNSLYRAVGVSKQAVHQYWKRHQQRQKQVELLCAQVDELRKEHPGVGLKKIYNQLKPDWLGRDRFIELMQSLGYSIARKRSPIKTTHPVKTLHCRNRLTDKKIRDINKGWQTDITYYLCGREFYYLTFIIDVYSRRIVGYAVSDSLQAEGNIAALKMAFRCRKGQSLKGLIHHSDRGSQYIDKVYVKLLKARKIKRSMCLIPQDNAYGERINGTIKNEYLSFWKINSYRQLKDKLRRAVNHYNHIRQHNHLKGVSPCQYEADIAAIPIKEREKLHIKPYTKS